MRGMVGEFTRGTVMAGALTVGFPWLTAAAPLAVTFGSDCARPMLPNARQRAGNIADKHGVEDGFMLSGGEGLEIYPHKAEGGNFKNNGKRVKSLFV
jgi:hypothetical protein